MSPDFPAAVSGGRRSALTGSAGCDQEEIGHTPPKDDLRATLSVAIAVDHLLGLFGCIDGRHG